MVYLKAYSLAVAKITIAIVTIDAREYYKNINPQGLSDNYSFAILSESVMITLQWSQYFKNSLPAQYNKTGNKMTMSYCIV